MGKQVALKSSNLEELPSSQGKNASYQNYWYLMIKQWL